MSKKKTAIGQPLEEPKRELPYQTFAWAGTERYQCNQCGLDCDSVEAVLRHIQAKHAPKLTPQRSPSGLVVADKNYRIVNPPDEGNVLATVEITEEDLKKWLNE